MSEATDTPVLHVLHLKYDKDHPENSEISLDGKKLTLVTNISINVKADGIPEVTLTLIPRMITTDITGAMHVTQAIPVFDGEGKPTSELKVK